MPGLWQDRFHSCALGEERFWPAVVYVERKAVGAKLVRGARQYAWSSAAAYVDGRDSTGLVDLAAWKGRLPADGDWRGASLEARAETAPAGG